MSKYTAKIPDENGHIEFTSEENETWKILIERQLRIVENRACDEYIQGLEILNMPRDRVPQCAEITSKLQQTTGWSVVPVPVLIPLKKFFQMLKNREFPAASFIRTREEIDYLQEPDIFHEFFGHCPLLTNQTYADFMQAYGEIALEASKEARTLLGRLFWFTIEFGLINTTKGLRIFGGGILSSFEETIYALESTTPERIPFEVSQVMQTDYRYDEIQKRYFIINNMSDLFSLNKKDLLQLAKDLSTANDASDFVTC